MEFLKSITQTFSATRRRLNSTSKTRRRNKKRSPEKKTPEKSASPKKSKIFEYVRRSAAWSGENQKSNEEKALSIIRDDDFDANKTQSEETILITAYHSRNMEIFSAILDHPSLKLSEVDTKKTIIILVHKANSSNNIRVLKILKSKGVFKRGYLPSELRTLVKDKI